MTVQEWDEAVDPSRMKLPREASQRKLRLLSVALAHLVVGRIRRPEAFEILDVFERFADGLAAEVEVRMARAVAGWLLQDGDLRFKVQFESHTEVPPGRDAEYEAVQLLRTAGLTRAIVPLGYRCSFWKSVSVATSTPAALVREVLGNPFRLVCFDPDWRTSATLAIARSMYENRDFTAAPILADALEDAGCEDATILDHLRHAPTHVRGCWAVDEVLGKE